MPGTSQNYRTVLFTIVSSVLDLAVEDRLITHNPCKARTYTHLVPSSYQRPAIGGVLPRPPARAQTA
ncbi:hypothetical protein ACQPWY_26370 [Pseudonocardia xinjiangensis]|uniref:hypothetical protein n=1 Tax=Pseudonocardia xinjiangensis TaxID=75289 RepID=UPI003D8A51B2